MLSTRIFARLLLLVTPLVMSAPAIAAAPADSAAAELADVKCVVAIGAATDALTDTEKAQMAVIGSFFIGKLYGRNPTFSPDSFFKRHMDTLNALIPRDEAVRCVQEVETSSAAFSSGK